MRRGERGKGRRDGWEGERKREREGVREGGREERRGWEEREGSQQNAQMRDPEPKWRLEPKWLEPKWIRREVR